MKKYIAAVAAIMLPAMSVHGQESLLNNPFATKGELVVPALQSSLVHEIVVVSENPGEWKFSATIAAEGDKEIVHITMNAPRNVVPAAFSVYFTFPQNGAFNLWTADKDGSTHLAPFWGIANSFSSISCRMPLYEYFDDNDRNCLTVACSETFRRVDAALGVMEEGCDICTELRFFREPEPPMSHYETRIMLDRRQVLWSESIREASEWMMKVNDFEAFQVPGSAYEPLYSTWYQFHQNVSADAVEDECRLAAGMGMKTVILDDGWQTEDGNRGYGFCGDWEVAYSKFPDMPAHVEAVHRLGMKYMVWFSVPYIGLNSKVYGWFAGKYLYVDEGSHCAVLDPRFPEVREYLVNTYANALRSWNIDGFKLDFIDSFGFMGEDPAVKENYAGRDIMSVSEAVDVLMKEVSSALRSIKPDILIEFRQNYIGSAIRQYGNMFRAADCPGNARDNRIRIASLRLTSGNTAVHSDMLEWNMSESPENVGRTIINSIFGVIQYSVMLKDVPESHLKMMQDWMKFASEHRKTLLQSEFRPLHPESGYPVIEAESDTECIVAVYQDNVVIDLAPEGKRVYILNASGDENITVRSGGKLRTMKVPCGGWKEIL